MPKIQVKSYAFSWNPKPDIKKGLVVLKTVDNKELRVPVGSAEEFAAIAAVLNETPVFLYPDGSLGTSWEDVG